MMWKEKLFNPFLRVAGFRALWIGLAVLMFTSGVAFFGRCHFDGALDIHIGADTLVWFYFAENLIAWALLSICLYLAGLSFSKSKIRFIDVAGTTALARWPMIFAAVTSLTVKEIPHSVNDLSAPILLFGSVSIICSIWMIALLYNAYSVSCNVKGTKGTISFIAAIIVAEVLSKLIILKIYPLF